MHHLVRLLIGGATAFRATSNSVRIVLRAPSGVVFALRYWPARLLREASFPARPADGTTGGLPAWPVAVDHASWPEGAARQRKPPLTTLAAGATLGA